MKKQQFEKIMNIETFHILENKYLMSEYFPQFLAEILSFEG